MLFSEGPRGFGCKHGLRFKEEEFSPQSCKLLLMAFETFSFVGCFPCEVGGANLFPEAAMPDNLAGNEHSCCRSWTVSQMYSPDFSSYISSFARAAMSKWTMSHARILDLRS